jgi:hypothetical protein
MAKPTPKKRAPRPIVPVEPKGYEAKRVLQRIQSENLFENLLFDPKYLPWMYVDNVIQRAIARVCGLGPYGPVTIKCSEDGSLFVSGIGGAYDSNETKQGAAPDDYGAAILFSKPMGRVDIFTLDNKMLIQRSRDNVKWDDEIFLFKDSFYSIDCTTLAFKVKNYVALAVANYRVIGWSVSG